MMMHSQFSRLPRYGHFDILPYYLSLKIHTANIIIIQYIAVVKHFSACYVRTIATFENKRYIYSMSFENAY